MGDSGFLIAKRVELLALDRWLAVALKPAGMLTQPTPERERDTLWSRVRVAVRRQSGSCPYLAAVHRLDRLASGLVLFARSRSVQRAFQEQLLDRSLTRSYEVIVAGTVVPDSGVVDLPLLGDGLRQKRRVARPDERGKSARTHFRVRERFQRATLLEVSLETGRTHQIRIHFAALGHPVLGDTVYGNPQARALAFPRLALHAGCLEAWHPDSGERIRWVAPLPPDLSECLEQLRRGRGPS